MRCLDGYFSTSSNTYMDSNPAIQDIQAQILLLRGKRVILDFHMAALYEVETRALKQQVRRNIERFPADFMFQLEPAEWNEVITNCDKLIPEKVKYSPSMPFAFTEQGVAMLSGVLRGPKAIEVNIEVMRAFVRMRRLMLENEGLWQKLESLEAQYDAQFAMVFQAIRELVEEKQVPRPRIGFGT